MSDVMMKVFISSTSKDLGEYRQAAHEVCNRLSLVPIGMEQFESMDAGATVGSRLKLEDADVYVGILANRYGYIESGFDKSVTELEFEHAQGRGIDRLFFVAGDAAKLPTYPGDDRAKLALFKARVDALIHNTFDNAWQFKYLLYDSLVKWLFRQPSAPVRRAFEPLLADYARFGGRAHDLGRIQAFLDDSGPGYLVITAPAGYGKTALAVKLVQQHRSVAAYHFFTSQYRQSQSDFLSEPFFLTSVVEQMKLWQLSPGRAAPTTLSAWVALYHELLARPFDQPHVLVLDGLDEVKDWSLRPYLNVELPVNLKLVVTIRDVGQPWAEEYGFPDKQTHHLALDGLTRADVAEVLRMAGPVATAFAGDAKLLDRVVDVTTPSDAVAGSDPLYVTFLADDIEKKQVTAANIAATPRKLEAYLALWWKAIQTQAKADVAARDLLGTLAAALGPVGRDDLAAMHPSLVSNWMDDPLSRVTGGLRRAVAGSDADGYAFAHPRFRDYVRRYPEIKGYEEKLVAYCRGWREHDKRWYAPRYTIRHFAKAGDFDALFATLLDDTFQAAQAQALASVRQTLDDLATAITIASDRDRFLDLLRCAGSHRRLAKAEGIARSIFANVAEGQFAAAAKAIDGYGFAKTSSAWVLALRCHLVGSAARADDGPAAKMLIEASGRQLGLSCHGAALHTTTLCDTLIAGALCRLPDLAADVGVDPSWAPAVLAALNLPSVDTATRGGLLADLDQRIGTLEATLGENPENPEYIDEVRAGEYMSHLRQSLIGVAGEAEGMILIRRALVAVQHNPYPRYRDIGLVAIGAAALAVPDATWAAARIEEILETGLEKEGMTFTFDLATQLATEAARRGLPTSNLAEYLKTAADSGDRWGTRMRSTSAWAAAQFTQGDAVSAFATLQSAAAFDEGFAGYMSAHLLSLASRWSEFDAAPRIAALGLMPKALVQAQRVRDPRFRQERQSLVGLFGQWLALAPPDWAELSAMLHRTADADTRRAYKDLVTARWVADDRRDHWGQVVVATLADATALDFVLARWAAYAIRRHRSGIRELPDSALGEALRLCEQRFAVSHPWESTLAAEYA